MSHASELAGPVQPTQRIGMLDVWRGFAVLGILLLNIPFFAMPASIMFRPDAWGSFDGADFGVWLVTYLLGDGKFLTMFSLLFGVGILVMTDRRVAAGQPWTGLHYRRMLVLLGIGLIHAYLIWYGDILVIYALCGMLLVWMRSLPVGGMWAMLVVLFAIGSGLLVLMGAEIEMVPEDDLAMLLPDEAAVAAEVDAYRGGWLEQMPYRATTAGTYHTAGFALMAFWNVGGLMAIGMALYRMGFLRGTASTRTYLAVLIAGLAVGLPLTGWGAGRWLAADFALPTFYVVVAVNLWADLLLALAYLSGVILLVRGGWVGALSRWLAAVGRLALTNYLLQSVICTTIFYGYGFGLFGHVDRLGQMGVVVLVWIVLVVFSVWWTRWFRFGPVEWVWRRLSYGEAPAMRREASAVEASTG